MLDSPVKISPMPPEARPSGSPVQHGQEADCRAVRLAHLHEQEQLWFSWLTVLHERLTKVKPGESVAEGLKVLDIARRRWLEAKQALREYQAGD